MAIDTTKSVKKVIYNPTELPLQSSTADNYKTVNVSIRRVFTGESYIIGLKDSAIPIAGGYGEGSFSGVYNINDGGGILIEYPSHNSMAYEYISAVTDMDIYISDFNTSWTKQENITFPYRFTNDYQKIFCVPTSNNASLEFDYYED